MITTIIVDDNKIIREYFQTMVDWNALGFELAAVCPNGLAAWEAFQRLRPRLVITDVHMPGLTGLELTKRIRETAPDTVVVFISNYEDFSYIKGAMELRVYDYILKHETRGAKLTEKLIRIKQHIDELNTDKRGVVEGRLLMSIISGDAEKLVSSFPDKYDCAVFEQASVLPAFRTAGGQDLPELEDRQWQTVFARFPQILCSVKLSKYRYGVLLEQGNGLEGFMRDVTAMLYDTARVNCCAMPIADNENIADCVSSFRSKIGFMKRKYFHRLDHIISTRELPRANPAELEGLREAMSQGDTDSLCRLIDDMGRTIAACEDCDALNDFASITLRVLESAAQRVGISLYGDRDYTFWTSSEEIFFWLKSKIIQLGDKLTVGPAARYSDPVMRAVQFMNENYHNSELTISDVAKVSGLGAGQLNKLMKAETGCTAIKWLTNTRMDKARQLLRGDCKLSRVYSQVGYANNSYFANVFKKNCGMTPLEYRRSAREEAN